MRINKPASNTNTKKCKKSRDTTHTNRVCQPYVSLDRGF